MRGKLFKLMRKLAVYLVLYEVGFSAPLVSTFGVTSYLGQHGYFEASASQRLGSDKGTCRQARSLFVCRSASRKQSCYSCISCKAPKDENSEERDMWSATGASVLNGDTNHETPSVVGPSVTPSGTGAIPPVVGDIRRLSTDTLCVRPRRSQDNTLIAQHGHFVELFRGCAPYIRAHQGSTMVAHIGGEILESPSFLSLMDDLGLLCLLGVSRRVD